MGLGAVLGHVLKGDLSKDYVGSYHPLSVIVVFGKSWDLKEG